MGTGVPRATGCPTAGSAYKLLPIAGKVVGFGEAVQTGGAVEGC